MSFIFIVKTNPLTGGISHLMEVNAMRSIAWALFAVSSLYTLSVILLGALEDGQLPVVLIIWVPMAAACALMARSSRNDKS